MCFNKKKENGLGANKRAKFKRAWDSLNGLVHKGLEQTKGLSSSCCILLDAWKDVLTALYPYSGLMEGL